MPKGCNECDHYYWSNIDQVYKCNLTKSKLQVNDAVIERNIDCPLVEIPKGARLIDAEALYIDIIHRFDYCDDFLEMLDEASTIFEEGDECKKK